jgi:hypothetical protein
MTALASWCGIDSHGVSSLYVVADSLISWTDGQKSFEQKVFFDSDSPQILGYCGDRHWGLTLANKLLTYARKLDEPSTFCATCFKWLREQRIPQTKSLSFDLEFLHCKRFPGKNFKVFVHKITKETGEIISREVALPEKSDKVEFLGKGRNVLFDFYFKWASSSDADTSRAVFGAFYDFLASHAEPSCGGPPQLLGLFREGMGKPHGVWFNGERFFLHKRVPYESNFENFEWRDATFQRVKATDGTLEDKAQVQPIPKFKSEYRGFGKIQNG